MAFRGSLGSPMNIESPKTQKQKQDAKKRQEANKRARKNNFELYTKYRCTVCLKDSEEVVKGHTHNFCQHCFITGGGLNIAEELPTKGKRLKDKAYLPPKRAKKPKKKKATRNSKPSVNK